MAPKAWFKLAHRQKHKHKHMCKQVKTKHKHKYKKNGEIKSILLVLILKLMS